MTTSQSLHAQDPGATEYPQTYEQTHMAANVPKGDLVVPLALCKRLEKENMVLRDRLSKAVEVEQHDRLRTMYQDACKHIDLLNQRLALQKSPAPNV